LVGREGLWPFRNPFVGFSLLRNEAPDEICIAVCERQRLVTCWHDGVEGRGLPTPTTTADETGTTGSARDAILTGCAAAPCEVEENGFLDCGGDYFANPTVAQEWDAHWTVEQGGVVDLKLN
jgi:hypothetical protein